MPPSSPSKSRFLPFLVLFLAIAAFVFYKFYPVLFPQEKPRPDYTIQGVAPVTLFSEGVLSSYVKSSNIAAMVTLLRYWGKPIDIFSKKEIDEIANLFTAGFGGKFPELTDYLQMQGLTFRSKVLATPKDLKNFINAETRTPLLFVMFPDKNFPDFPQYRVLVGVNEEKQIITFHDFLFGNNIQMTFNEVEESWKVFASSSRVPNSTHRYWAIQPINLAQSVGKLPQNPSPYPPRLKVADALHPIMPYYLFGKSYLGSDPEKSNTYFSLLIDNPLFIEFHPGIQATVYSFLAESNIQLKNFARAKDFLEKADKINNNLNLPYRDWPLVKPSKVSIPLRVWSEYYTAIGDKKQAEISAKAYSKAREEFVTAIEAK